MVKRPSESASESSYSYLPNVVRQILESKSAKTIAALAALFVAEAGNSPTVEAQEQGSALVQTDSMTPQQLMDLIELKEAEFQTIFEDYEALGVTLANTAAPTENVTPTVRLKKPINSTSATLQFSDIEVGSQLLVKKSYGDGGVVIRVTLTEVTGSVSIQSPRADDRIGHYVYIVSPDGTTAYVGGWETIYGKNMGTNDLVMSAEQAANLAHENPLYAEAVEERNELNAEMEDMEEQMFILDDQIRGLQSDLEDLYTPDAEGDAEYHLYSRMHVTENGPENIGIHFMTPADSVEFVVDTANPTLGAYHTRRATSNHEGGILDGYMNMSLYGITAPGTEITVSMMVNGVVQDQVTLRQGNSGISGGSNWEWGQLEEGRMSENSMDTSMEIVATNGAQLMLAGQTSYDGVYVEMEGGGYLNKYLADTENGSNLFMQNFAFNASNPSGIYKVKMYESKNGMQVAELEFYWDAGTGTITPRDNNMQVAALEDPGMEGYVDEMREQMQNQADLDEIDIGFVSLRTVQRTLFSERSAYFIPDTEFDALLANFPIQGHPDSGSILNEGMAVYNETLGELLQFAAEVSIAAWNGEDQEAAVEAFYAKYDELSQLRKLNEFKIDFGVEFPSADQILRDGMNIAQEYIGDLQVIQAKEISMRKRSAYLANKEGPETEKKISEEAFEYTKSLLAEIHGENSAVYVAYVQEWGDEKEAEKVIAAYLEYLALTYGEGSEEYVVAAHEYLDGVDYYVVSYEEEKSAEKDYVRAAVERAIAQIDGPILTASADPDFIDSILNSYDDRGINLLTPSEILHVINESIIYKAGAGSVVAPEQPLTVGDIESLVTNDHNNPQLSETEKEDAFFSAEVSALAYYSNPADSLLNSLEGVNVLHEPDIGINNGLLKIGNATVVFVEVEFETEKILYVGFKGTDKLSPEKTFSQNVDAANDIYNDIVLINQHVDTDAVAEIVGSLKRVYGYSEIVITGHSLGGAMAQKFMTSDFASLEANKNIISAYTYGNPGLLNSDVNDDRIINFVHDNDLVPFLGENRAYLLPFIVTPVLNPVDQLIPHGHYIRSGIDYYISPDIDPSLKEPFAPHEIGNYIDSASEL